MSGIQKSRPAEHEMKRHMAWSVSRIIVDGRVFVSVIFSVSQSLGIAAVRTCCLVRVRLLPKVHVQALETAPMCRIVSSDRYGNDLFGYYFNLLNRYGVTKGYGVTASAVSPNVNRGRALLRAKLKKSYATCWHSGRV